MTISEIFELEGVNLLNKYDVILRTLIKKNSDKNSIISDEAERALTAYYINTKMNLTFYSFCITCNCTKVIVVLLDILKGNSTNDLIATIIKIYSKVSKIILLLH